jgi:hypothetical protein
MLAICRNGGVHLAIADERGGGGWRSLQVAIWQFLATKKKNASRHRPLIARTLGPQEIHNKCQLPDDQLIMHSGFSMESESWWKGVQEI